MKKIPHLKVSQIPNFSFYDTHILHKIKFSNFRKPKSVILESLSLILEKISHITKIHKFWKSENCKLACSGLYRIVNLLKFQIAAPLKLDDGSYGCPFCSKTYPHHSNMKIHILTHTGEKPVSCPNCDFKCTTKWNLFKHQRNKHSQWMILL